MVVFLVYCYVSRKIHFPTFCNCKFTQMIHCAELFFGLGLWQRDRSDLEIKTWIGRIRSGWSIIANRLKKIKDSLFD